MTREVGTDELVVGRRYTLSEGGQVRAQYALYRGVTDGALEVWEAPTGTEFTASQEAMRTMRVTPA